MAVRAFRDLKGRSLKSIGCAAFVLLALAGAAAQAQEIRAQKVSSTTTSLAFNFEVVNTSAASIANLKVQYFVNPTGDASVVVPEVDYTTATSLTKSVQTLSATVQVVTFDFGTQAIAAGAKLVVNARLHLSGNQVINLADDYSYAGLTATMVATPKMALLKSGALVFGTTPNSAPTANVVKITKPLDLSVSNSADLTVEWTVNGKKQYTQNTERLVPGFNEVTRCFVDTCASIRVTLRTQPIVYEPGLVVPDPQELFTVLAPGGIVLHDRSQLRGTKVVSGVDLRGGVQSLIESGLEVRGALALGGQATLRGTYAVAGAVTIGAGSTVSAVRETISGTLALLPTVVAAPGGPNVVYNATQTLTAGDYGQLNVPPGGVLILDDGAYSFQNLVLNSDAVVRILGRGKVSIRANYLTLADRVSMAFPNGGNFRQLTFQTSQTQDLRVGTDSKMGGILIAPNAKVVIADRANWKGSVLAKLLDVGSDAVVDGRGVVSALLAKAGAMMGGKGLENLLVSSSRGAVHISSKAMNTIKRVEVLPIWGDTGYTYLDGFGIETRPTKMAREFLPKMAFLQDEELKFASFDKLMMAGSEIVDGVDCWKIRVSEYKAPWFLLVYFPEKELYSGQGVVWVSKTTGRLVRLDLEIDDPRPESSPDGVVEQPIGKENYRFTLGPCATLPIFKALDTIKYLRVVVEGGGAKATGTSLSEIQFTTAGVPVYPAFTGPSPNVVGKRVAVGTYPGRPIGNAWKLFNRDALDDGWQELSTSGESQFDLRFFANTRPDELRLSGPALGSSGPAKIQVLASTNGVDWKSLYADSGLVWNENETKIRKMGWDRLANTCVPTSIKITVPGLAAKMDSATKAFYAWKDMRKPGEAVNQYLAGLKSVTDPLPTVTEEDKNRKLAMMVAYKRAAMMDWLSLHNQVRQEFAQGKTGVELSLKVTNEVITAKEYFLPGSSLPKTVP